MNLTNHEPGFLGILEANKGIIYKIANAYCKNAANRQDLIQEVILQLWLAFPKYNEKFRHSTWIYRIGLTRMKVQSYLQSMQPVKIFTILVGFAWVLFLAALVITLYTVANSFFLVSAGLLAVLNLLAIGLYLYQAILIQQADISEPILATQEKIARLTSSTLLIARILFLQLPLWTTFYWNKSLLDNGNISLILLQLFLTTACTYISLWLFFNIKFENKEKKWFTLIFKGKEWNPILQSMDLLNQIKSYSV